MTSLRRHEGFLSVDHRNSPGISDADLTPELRARGFTASRGLFEAPTVRCCHCGTIVILNPDRKRERHYCAPCDHYVCDQPPCITSCTPFERKVDAAMDAAVIEEAKRRLRL